MSVELDGFGRLQSDRNVGLLMPRFRLISCQLFFFFERSVCFAATLFDDCQ